MGKIKDKHSHFHQGLEKLGFDAEDDCLFLTETSSKSNDPQIEFHLEKGKEFEATAVFIRKQLNGSYKPQAYLYDYTGKAFEENVLTEIQKKIWSSGEAPLACIFYTSEIKILDCTRRINDNYTPVYLIESLNLSANAHKLYNELFAVKIKSGVFWEEEELKSKFKFQNSAYDILIGHIRKIRDDFYKEFKKVDDAIINKLIIQSILIKYLEERVDDVGKRLFSDKYFKKFGNSKSFTDVLRKKGKCVNLFEDLNSDFNGNIFSWSTEEKTAIKQMDLSILANALDADYTVQGQGSFWRYYEFNYVPVELISRLYEEFLGENKQEKGLFYTPSHLAKLLVDEAMPLKNYAKIDLDNYKILDPACGSGIFLVIAYKRLIQWWRLKNNLKRPELSDLKKILENNIHGVDMEQPAVRLSAFSLCLALCDELTPKQIIEQLKFEDLTKENIIHSDFFHCTKLGNKKFDLIIGNPPFDTGAIKKYSSSWEYEGEKIKIPQGQIALKFLCDSLTYLKEKGLLCLIIKSSGLLYNSSSVSYKNRLFSKFNVIQILDFTGLARNKSLWDNGADVGAAAIYLRNEKSDPKKNILHLTFRRTKATKERIVFEIDDYDLHFVNRQVAIENNFIWKNNLLGGGRIKSIIEQYKTDTFEQFLKESNCIVGEGFKVGSKGKLNPSFIYKMKTLPTEAIDEHTIDLNKLQKVDPKIKFEKIPDKSIFTAPNIVIWENIGQERIPLHYNTTSFSFQHKLIGISNSNEAVLKKIASSFKKFNDFYRFYIFATSGQVLVNLNTAILKSDIMQLPFIKSDKEIKFSNIEINVINDVNKYMQDFMRHGEKSLAVKSIGSSSLNPMLTQYGHEFSHVLNLIYQDKKRRFRLSDVVSLCDNSFIATVFKYDDKNIDIQFHSDNSELNLKELTDQEISRHLNINRIVKLYSQKDTIVFIKPNQNRYWLSITAYRDADKCFADLTKLGY